ncbi:MAG TPA: peptide ABC transporter substrate-binding protein, partial [Tepidisphaeraceae bacterium]|nr:peptide ABC transporter substrate-binding protein [Tepidisphaeraceae bacterium]
MWRLLVIALALVAAAVGAIVWSQGATRPPAAFTFINRNEINTLDPNRMSWLQDIRIGYALWEGLYAVDPQTLRPVPGTADRIDVSPDKTVWTFHIRSSARWSNAAGDPVTSGDFVFAWRRMLEQPGEYTYLFHCIRGAEDYENAYAANKPCDFSTVGISAPSADILRVTLKHPVAYFPDLCAFAPFFPLNAKSMEPFIIKGSKHPVEYRGDFTRPPYLVTNGPYRLADWDFKRDLYMEKNPWYWDAKHVKSPSIEMLDSTDPEWSYLEYQRGAVDWIAEVSGEIPAELFRQHRSDLHVFPGFGTYFYSLNCQPTLPGGAKNPLADVRVRQALDMAIDKHTIVDTVTRMGEPIAEDYIPPGIFPGYHSPAGIGYNIAKARQLIAAAGYVNGQNFPRLSILYNTDGNHGAIAEVIRRQWQQNLGISMDLESVEIKVFRERLHNKEYSIARASWIGDYNDVSTFTDKYLSNAGNNDSGWSNPKYDALCHAAELEPDPARRLA